MWQLVSFRKCAQLSACGAGNQVEYKETLDLKSVLHLPEGRKLFAEFTVKEHSEENLKVTGRMHVHTHDAERCSAGCARKTC